MGVTAGEIASAVAGVFADGPGDPAAFERTLADLVQAAHLDWFGLRGALAAPAEKYALDARSRRDLPLATPLRQLHEVVEALVWLPVPSRRRGANTDVSRLCARLSFCSDRPAGMDPHALRTPVDILTLRIAEAAARIGGPSPVDLVSTPTHQDGWLDPDALLARVSQAEREGWQPWPIDFDQALLRLPARSDPATVRAAHRLASPAGRRLAGWLRGGRPTLPRIDADLVGPAPRRRPRPLAMPPQTTGGPTAPTTLIHLLRRGWYAPRCVSDGSCWAGCWPSLLPGHCDLVASAHTWHREHADEAKQNPHKSVLVAAAVTAADLGGEPPGPGMAAALARGLTARSAARRAEAAAALAALAGAHVLSGDALGAALVRFGTRFDRQILRTAVPALRGALVQPTGASRAAAGTLIGTAIIGWLPGLLPPAVTQPLPYTAPLLDTAAAAFAGGEQAGTKPPAVPEQTVNALVALAQRPGTSSVTAAALRLLAARR